MKRKQFNITRNKYSAKKTVIDGIKFDSKKEANRYLELKMLEKAKQITDLELQPAFELIPTQKYQGETLRKVKYIADFQYKDLFGDVIVEDTKGFKTTEYIIKKKLFIQKYGNDVIFKEI